MGVGCQHHAVVALPSQKKKAVPRAGLPGAQKLAPTGIVHRTVHAILSRCTDWAIPAHRPYWNAVNYVYNAHNYAPIQTLLAGLSGRAV
jgi:hypothetical protein